MKLETLFLTVRVVGRIDGETRNDVYKNIVAIGVGHTTGALTLVQRHPDYPEAVIDIPRHAWTRYNVRQQARAVKVKES